jgi:hypothetical protein
MSNVVTLESYRQKTSPSPKPTPPQLWHQRLAEWTLEQAREPQFDKMLSEREVRFLMNVETWARPISDKQKIWLHDIVARIKIEVDKMESQPTSPPAA